MTPLGHLGSPFDTHWGGGKARFFEIGVGGTGRQAFTILKYEKKRKLKTYSQTEAAYPNRKRETIDVDLGDT